VRRQQVLHDPPGLARGVVGVGVEEDLVALSADGYPIPES
jgi:hypothetical protein